MRQRELAETSEETPQLLKAKPDDKDRLEVKRFLKVIQDKVARHWPLPPEDRKRINIGIWAVRELEGGPYGDLVQKLTTLEAHLTK